MIAVYNIPNDSQPEQVGPSFGDDEIEMLKQAKISQAHHFDQEPKVIMWIVYRPDRIPVA